MGGRERNIASLAGPESAGHADRPSTALPRPRLTSRRGMTVTAILFAVASLSVHARADDPGATEFFEKSIRPILAEKCQKCHGGARTRGGLSLAGRAMVLKGGDSGPAAVPGKPRESLIIAAVEQHGELKMPPEGKLSPGEVDRLRRWIELDMPWPESHAGDSVAPGTAAADRDDPRDWWAFRPVRAATPPAVKDAAWVRSEIDRFILAALEAREMRPSPAADRRPLIRRATYDLTGLPPTPEEVESFVADGSPGAFARVVDRLLASPAYGERWGRHWLDVVRYADARDLIQLPAESDFREAWRYRDWVVAAFNRDMSYAEFVRFQIAGDLMPPRRPGGINPDAIVATGLLALADFVPGDVDKDQMIADYVDDQVNVVGKAFLGLTIGCARCHDHKFDPISAEDYYALAGIFFSTSLVPGPVPGNTPLIRVPLLAPDELARLRAQDAAETRRRVELEHLLDELRSARGPFWPAAAERRKLLPPEHRAQRDALARELEVLKKKPGPEIPRAVAVRDGGPKGTRHEGFKDAQVFLRGDHKKPGKTVPRGFPRILTGGQPARITEGSGRRQLADWLTRPDHPLTARVMVNRIWEHHIGEGLVRTANDFGRRGDAPSHPGLLDHLATRFVQSGWSLKVMHRLIMLSSTYQQSARVEAAGLAADPENRLLGRMNRRRLDAEAIRDGLLAVAGRLEARRGGPAFAELAVPRRTLYLMSVRTGPGSSASDFGRLFNRADPGSIVARRDESVVAPQALFFLNDPFVIDLGRALAARLAREEPGGGEPRIRRLYALALARPPSAAEMDLGRQLLAPDGDIDPWERYCQIILSSNEFLYID
jgi:hypothetical protein